MRRLLKSAAAGGAVGAGVYWAVLTPQQQSNVQGAYRSVVNSSRAGFVLYQSVRDYQVSL